MSAADSQPFPIMLGLTVASMKKSLEFYVKRLGFTIKESWPNETDAKWASLVLAKQNIMLGEAMEPEACAEMHVMDEKARAFWTEQAKRFAGEAKGVGVNCYLHVPDIDGYAIELRERGIEPKLPPTSQFYGIRDLVVTDPDGYLLTFYTPITMESCQSCGMPLADAKPGEMFCPYCVDESGQLRPFEQIFEGTVTGYFMAHLKMDRAGAEQAARQHLAKMPAWSTRS